MKVMRRFMISLLVITGLFIVFIHAGAYIFQRQLMYFPMGVDLPPWNARPITITTHDGLKVKSWYVAPANDELPVIMHFHGNAGNVMSRYHLMQGYIKRGYGAFLVEYRGYNGNPGKPNEADFYKDGLSAYQWLLGELADEAKRIVIYGESIGSGSAVYVATQSKAQALILEVPFDSMLNVSRNAYPFLFFQNLLLKDQHNNISRIQSIDMPLLIMLAEHDDVVPARLGKNLYDAALEPKFLKVYQGAGHNDIYIYSPIDDVISFLESNKKSN